jgi:hypothetical protein
VPGVADAERRTQLAQDQRKRKKEREDLLRLVAEGRIHEVDEHQLELIKLALELGNMMDNKGSVDTGGIDLVTLQAALRGAVAEVVSSIPTPGHMAGPTGSHASDPARPKMKHTSLTSISHEESDLNISHSDTLAEEKESEEDAAAKLKRLKELKGSK